MVAATSLSASSVSQLPASSPVTSTRGDLLFQGSTKSLVLPSLDIPLQYHLDTSGLLLAEQ